MENLQQQLTEFMLTPSLSEKERLLAAEIICLAPETEKFSQKLVDDISTLLITCDKIPSEAMDSLRERLVNEMKKEREVILSLYPRPYQCKDGRWIGRPYGDGNRKTLIKRTLKEWDDAIIAHHKAQQIKGMTLEVAVQRYHDDRDDISDNTKVRNTQDMKRFAGDLMKRPISSITALDIQKQYVSSIIATEPSMKTCNNYKGILRRIFKHAARHYGCETIDINECIDILNTEVNRAIIRKPERQQLFAYPKDRFTKDEVLALKEEAWKRDTLDALGCLVPLYTGQRIGEVSGMFKKDLDLDSRIIYIRHTAKINRLTKEQYIGEPKMEKDRVIVFPEAAVPLFERILELSDPELPYLFTNKREKRACDWFPIYIIDKEYRDICKKLKFKEIKSAHDMRRTYDSILDEVSMSSALRHLLLGHELTGIDANYLRDNHSVKEVQDVINSAFDNFFNKKTA